MAWLSIFIPNLPQEINAEFYTFSQTTKHDDQANRDQFARPENMLAEFKSVSQMHEGTASENFNVDENYKQYLNEAWLISNMFVLPLDTEMNVSASGGQIMYLD